MLFEVHRRDLMMKLFELKINYCSAFCFYKAGFFVRFKFFCDEFPDSCWMHKVCNLYMASHPRNRFLC